MANAWLRLWHDMPNDPKWRTIARISGQPIALVQAIYLQLLVSASQNPVTDETGVTSHAVTVTNEDIASALDVTESDVDSVTDAMQGRVLDGNIVSGWDRRQATSVNHRNPGKPAKSGAQRTREYRERKKLEAQQKARPVQPEETVTTSDVTETSRNAVTPQIRKEEIREDLKELNPTHNARAKKSDQSGGGKPPAGTVPETPGPEPGEQVPGCPSTPAAHRPPDITPQHLPGLDEPVGKFVMQPDWRPSLDFRRRAATWGVSLPEPVYLPEELASFADYWISEGKVFTQVQWEQKFARHVSQVRGRGTPVSNGGRHAKTQPDSTASQAVRKIRAARERWEREHGIVIDHDGLETLGAHGGGLLGTLEPEERGRTHETLGCPDWVDD